MTKGFEKIESRLSQTLSGRIKNCLKGFMKFPWEMKFFWYQEFFDEFRYRLGGK